MVRQSKVRLTEVPLDRLKTGPITTTPFLLMERNVPLTEIKSMVYYRSMFGPVLVALNHRGVACRCWYTVGGVVSIEGLRVPTARLRQLIVNAQLETLYLSDGVELGSIRNLAKKIVYLEKNKPLDQILANLDQSSEQERAERYELLARMYNQRQNHKQWRRATETKNVPVDPNPSVEDIAAVPSYQTMLDLTDGSMTPAEYQKFQHEARQTALTHRK